MNKQHQHPPATMLPVHYTACSDRNHRSLISNIHQDLNLTNKFQKSNRDSWSQRPHSCATHLNREQGPLRAPSATREAACEANPCIHQLGVPQSAPRSAQDETYVWECGYLNLITSQGNLSHTPFLLQQHKEMWRVRNTRSYGDGPAPKWRPREAPQEGRPPEPAPDLWLKRAKSAALQWASS